MINGREVRAEIHGDECTVGDTSIYVECGGNDTKNPGEREDTPPPTAISKTAIYALYSECGRKSTDPSNPYFCLGCSENLL
jgi:hypothetical protein